MRPFPGAVPFSLAFLISTVTPSASLVAQAEQRWVVDNTAAPSGDGSPTSPFVTIAEAVQAAGEGDVIVVSASEQPYAGPVVLRSGQTLLGQGVAPAITAANGNVITLDGAQADVTIANVRVQATGSASGMVVRNARAMVTLRDVAVETSGGTGISVSTATRLAIDGASTISSVDATALTIENAAIEGTFRSVSARGSRLVNGIVLERTTGRLGLDGGTIEGAAVRAVSAIDASGLALRGMRIVASASASGVAAAQCGGDLIEGSNERCHAAVYLHNVTGATLERMEIDGSGQAGLVAHAVRDLSIVDSRIRNAGDELFEHGVVLEELSGECRITGTAIERSASRNLMLHNSGGRLVLTIEKSTFTDTAAPHGQHGALITAAGDAVLDLRVRDSAFLRTFSHGLEVAAQGKASVTARVSGSTFEKNASAISLAATGSATLDYVISDNPAMSGGSASAINIYLGTPSSGAVSGTIARNVIGKSGVARSGAGCDSCSGIVLRAAGDGTMTSHIDGNIVQQTGGGAIQVAASQGGSRMNVTVTSNLLRESASASAPAIRVQSGALAGDHNHVCADLGGRGARANKIEGAWEPNGAIHLMHRFGGTRFQLAGLTSGKDDAAAAAAVSARNGDVKVRAVLRPDSMERGFEPAEGCTMPALMP